MRVAPYEFFCHRLSDVCEGKDICFSGELRVKTTWKSKSPVHLPDPPYSYARSRQLLHKLLDGIRNQAVYSLFEIPGTTMFSVSQHSHDLEQFFDGSRISCKFTDSGSDIGRINCVVVQIQPSTQHGPCEETYPLHQQISIDSLVQATRRCLGQRSWVTGDIKSALEKIYVSAELLRCARTRRIE